MKSGVYAIRNTRTGKAYVGSSVDMQRRRRTHWRELRNGTHGCAKLQRSWLKHGADSFAFEVLETVASDEAELRGAEQRWIDRLDAVRHGYNVNPVAGNVGRMPKSAEHRKKIGDSRRGRKHTPEVRARLSELAKRRPNTLTPERAKQIGALGGRKLTQAERDHLSALRTGVPTGPMPAHQRAAISASKQGKPLSAHHRQRIREGQLARYAKTKQTYETGLIGTADHSRERVRHHAD